MTLPPHGSHLVVPADELIGGRTLRLTFAFNAFRLGNDGRELRKGDAQ